MNSKPLIFFGLIWTAMVLLFDGFIVIPATRQVMALRYSTTEGKVLSAQVTQHDGEDGPTFGVKIRYTYRVNGRDFENDRFRYQSGSSSDSAWAYEAVNRHAPGSWTTVHYNPLNPSDALLSPGVAGSDLFMLMFMTPFNAVMLGFWMAGAGMLRRQWFKPVAGGVPIVTRLRVTRARLVNGSPATAAVVTMAAMAFACIFLVGFLSGFHPSLGMMVAIWGVIVSGGIVAGGWQWMRIHGGRYDLILNELDGCLELPLTHGRKTRVKIPYAKIQAVFVATVEKGGENPTRFHAPSLRIGEGEGTVEKLAEWMDPDKAAAFAGWLSEKLPVRKPAPVADRRI